MMSLGRFLLALALLSAPPAAAGQSQDSPQSFGGEYRDLSARQKELLDDLYHRFAEVTGTPIDPETTYDGARLSSRTTFEAITHALATTELTNVNGESLGTALDLVKRLEAVAPGNSRRQSVSDVRRAQARRGRASRALSSILAQGDNTVYHKDYPLNYRQSGGVPSIQFSVTRTLERTDIDLDYRSSRFPAALFNGHLASSNSDVRAGNNVERHNARWAGFVNWWRAFFGLPLSDTTHDEDPPREIIAATPRAGKERIDVAVRDFLQAWLVEARPNVAAGYFSERAYACLALEKDGEELVYGMAPFELMVGMRAVEERLGPVERLEDVAMGVRLTRPFLTVVEQPHHAQFVLYGVPDEVAAAFDCQNRTRMGERPEPRPARRGMSLEDFDYFGGIVFLEGGDARGSTVALLWTKENGQWRIVSYEVEPEGAEEDRALPDLRPETTTTELERVDGDPELIAATERFLEAWLVEKDVEEALRFFAPECYPCVNLDLDPDKAPWETAEEQAQRLRFGLSRTTAQLGRLPSLEAGIDAVELVLPDVRIVTHRRERAYSLFAITDLMGENARGARRLEGLDAAVEGVEASGYGNYYLSAMRIDTVAGETRDRGAPPRLEEPSRAMADLRLPSRRALMGDS